MEELGGGDDINTLKRVQKECRSVLKELQKAVILGGFSGGLYQYSNGVSVFFPWSRDAYEVSRKNYESLSFAKDVKRERLSWTDFLKKYLYDVSLRRFAAPFEDASAGSKYRYYSGVRFDEQPRSIAVSGNGASRTKIAGQEGTRIAGQEGTRIAGQEGMRLAGGGTGGFFQSMRMFKNVESRWNISGFTKKPDETEAEDHPLTSNAKAGAQ